ncbi:tRNA-dependent cyclodipeptide synthase [Okeania sp.]|uniref:tRNA-dependent cyclodipeptide synthase n=1 Tax=Okeania sp. TaxID=3100323 RepID=UPI002B4AEF05|nr:tRNA-dependent cyclodipeptide synthase [Okeania sp.]MEB3343496.1 tRNA-dependent cyclodipeptide synthase [Okeania sp.]
MSSSTDLESIDWSELSLERLQLLQSRISKVINIKIQEKLTRSTSNFTKDHKYKASLAKVFPQSMRSSLFNNQKCVFAISLGSKNFVYSERVEACIRWISDNFKNCLVLVGDSLHRLTIEAREGIEEDLAYLKAIRTGEKFIDDHYLLFQEYSESCQFEFKMISEIGKQLDFDIYYEELQSLYGRNESFENTVNSFAEKYLNRGRPIEAGQVQDPRQKYLARRYLLEESALFACIAKQEWLVFVYPGSIKTFEEISEGLHPEVPEPLKQITWVSLGLKRLNAKESK